MKKITKKISLFGTVLSIITSVCQANDFSRESLFSQDISQQLRKCASCGKNIVFLEPYGATIPFLERGLERGYHITVLTADKDLRIVPTSILQKVSCALKVDTINEEEVRNALLKIREFVEIRALIPGFEYFVPIAIRLSNELRLPSMRSEDAYNLRRKDIMRQILSEKSIPTPKFILVDNISEVESSVKEIGFPVVCKPVDAAGSVNVKRADNIEETLSASRRILENEDELWGHKLAQKMLLEEYVEGDEYSVEGVVQNNKIFTVSVTQKILSDEYDFIEVGHISNPPLEESKKDEIVSYVEQVLTALNADNVPFHAELRYTKNGPILMEVAGRLAGDRISEIINRSTGINYYDMVYKTYLGEKVDFNITNPKVSGIRFFYRPEIEVIKDVRGLENVRALPGVEDVRIYYQPEVKIPDFPKPLRRMGHVIVNSPDYNVVKNSLEEANKVIEITPAEENNAKL